MTPQTLIAQLLEFARTAGQAAINYQYKLQTKTNYLKNCAEVRTLVTKADLQISRQFRSFVETHFAKLNPLIVDEESISILGDKPFEKINAAEYVFIIDPIDGTLTYANHMALYGISVGVYKNGKPCLFYFTQNRRHERQVARYAVGCNGFLFVRRALCLYCHLKCPCGDV